MKLVKYLKEKSIDIALIQEHNIKSKEKIEYLLQFYTVILNKTILSNKQKQEYTYYRKSYAARLDRIYLNKLFSNIKDNFTYPAFLSDHLL